MTRVEFNEKMLSKFADGRSKGGRFWKGFKLKRREDEFESSRTMDEGADFGMGQVQWTQKLRHSVHVEYRAQVVTASPAAPGYEVTPYAKSIT